MICDYLASELVYPFHLLRTDVAIGVWNIYLSYYQPRFAPQYLGALHIACAGEARDQVSR